jgi:hypothetical protein
MFHDLSELGSGVTNHYGIENLSEAMENVQGTPRAIRPSRAGFLEHMMNIHNALVEVQIREVKWETIAFTVLGKGQNPGGQGMSNPFSHFGLTV